MARRMVLLDRLDLYSLRAQGVSGLRASDYWAVAVWVALVVGGLAGLVLA